MVSMATLSWSSLARRFNCSRESRALIARHFLLIIILYVLVGSNRAMNVVFPTLSTKSTTILCVSSSKVHEH